jgi:sphinganine-1-phosphate aldolase
LVLNLVLMVLPPSGRPAADVLAELAARKAHDVRWEEGRAFTLAYHAGPQVLALQRAAYAALSTENALNTDAFPSLRVIQAEVVEMVAAWCDAPEPAGFMTSGGTESILLAVLAARQRGRAERGVDRPNMVLPTSAHAAFEKAAFYFGVESRRIPVREDWRADVDAMADAVDGQTVLVVASAPQYPQGVIDPVAEVAALAAGSEISCHVDACMGGVTLPYLRRLGHPVPPWSFAVDGVTSVSVDLHKFGYTAKGASVILHRDKALRRHQVFVTDNWLGGTYGSSGLLGTKSGGAMAAAWAVMQHLGDDGYLALTAAARRATEHLADAVDAMPDLRLRARPDTTLVAFGAAPGSGVDVFAVADALWRRGWYVDRQGPPPSLHCTVNAVHDGRIGEFVADLRAAVEEAGGQPGAAGAYGTVE